MALSTNLVSYYKFNSGALTTDDLGANTLTNNNTVGETSSGLVGYGCDFSNSNTNKYFSSTTQFQVSAMSYSFWFKMYAELSGADTNNGIISLGNDTTKVNISFMYQRSSGVNRILGDYRKYGTGDSYNIYNVNLGTTWHHIVMTYDGTNMKMYLDGVQRGGDTAVSGGGTGSESGAGLNFGRLVNTSTSYISAVADELGIWSRAITAAEVVTLYNAGLGFQYSFTAANAKVLVVGAGGSGIPFISGGGGAGCVKYAENYTLTATNYSVTVATAPAEFNYHATASTAGSSTFGSITAGGGGNSAYGGTDTYGSAPTSNAGSGGGGATTSAYVTGATGTGGGFYNAGGTAPTPGGKYPGAGGGGAGTAGGSPADNNSAAGNGGDGIDDGSVGNLLSLTSSGVDSGGTRYIAGGGGGGTNQGASGTPGTGGKGGGGSGSATVDISGSAGKGSTQATANTGSGGGGSSASATNNSNMRSGIGASGIVIVASDAFTFSSTGTENVDYVKGNSGATNWIKFLTSQTLTTTAVPTNTSSMLLMFY